MSQDHFYASDVAWQRDALCKGAPVNFAPDKETPQGLARARTWCDRCPVRTECLAYAFLYRSTGYWGGTDTAERRRLAVPRNRVKCPVCRSKAIVLTPDGHEICQHCGISWRGSGSRLPEEAAR